MEGGFEGLIRKFPGTFSLVIERKGGWEIA